MFDSSQLAIVRTRLPYTDRGALSQAWLSALGLEHARATVAPLRRDPVPAVSARAARTAIPVASERSARELTPGVRVRATVLAEPRPGREPENAAVRAHERRSAAPGAPRPAAPAFRSWLTLPGAGGERIHLVVRRTETAVDVVALCRPRVAGIVRRALAGAALARPLTAGVYESASA